MKIKEYRCKICGFGTKDKKRKEGMRGKVQAHDFMLYALSWCIKKRSEANVFDGVVIAYIIF